MAESANKPGSLCASVMCSLYRYVLCARHNTYGIQLTYTLLKAEVQYTLDTQGQRKSRKEN